MIASFFLSLIIGFAFFMALHIFIWRVAPSNFPRIGLLIFLCLVGMFTAGAISFLLQKNICLLVSLFFTNCFLYIGYLYYYSGIVRSVSITLLSSLRGKSDVEIRTLFETYLASARFEDRLPSLSIKTGGEKVS
jgi:hypothetical protein